MAGNSWDSCPSNADSAESRRPFGGCVGWDVGCSERAAGRTHKVHNERQTSVPGQYGRARVMQCQRDWRKGKKGSVREREERTGQVKREPTMNKSPRRRTARRKEDVVELYEPAPGGAPLLFGGVEGRGGRPLSRVLNGQPRAAQRIGAAIIFHQRSRAGRASDTTPHLTAPSVIAGPRAAVRAFHCFLGVEGNRSYAPSGVVRCWNGWLIVPWRWGAM